MNSNKIIYSNKSSKCNSGCSCGSKCGNSLCKCANSSFYEDENKLIFFDDDSYAIYRLGKWNNKYQINLLGIDNEIPVTEITKNQSLKIMEEIRKYKFKFKGVEINGMVGLAIRYVNLTFNGRNIGSNIDINNNNTNIITNSNHNYNIDANDIVELIDIEKVEYENIKKELADLKLESPKDFVELDNERFLIYKLKENCQGVVMSRPMNKFTRKHCTVELSKIKLSTI